jgi:hypothetical protein
MKPIFSFWFGVDNQQIIGGRHVKCGMDTDHKHTYKFCLQVNSYKCGESAKLCGYVQQI